MKKIYSIIALFAMLCTTTCMFTSCGNDDEPEPEVKPDPKYYGRYKAKLSEDIFTYCDVTVTIQTGLTKNVYKFDEKTKVADIAVENVEHPERPYPGRVLDIPVFEFSSFPLRFTTDIKLSEAGQKLVDSAKAIGKDSNNPDSDVNPKMDFIVSFDYGECSEKGVYYNHVNRQVVQDLPYEGIYVMDLPGFLHIFHDAYGSYFDLEM